MAKQSTMDRASEGAKAGSIGGPYGAIGGAIDGALNGPIYKAHAKRLGLDKDDPAGGRRVDEIAQLLGLSGDVFRSAGLGEYLAGARQGDVANDFFDQVINRYPELARREREATFQQHAWDVNDMRTNGAKMQALIEGMAPELKGAGDAIARMLSGVGDDSELLQHMNRDALTDGTSDINTRLHDSAMSELDLGGTLSPDEIRNIQQDSRAGYSARGMLGSDASIIEEAMNLGVARKARERERQKFAADINELLLGEQSRDRGFAADVEGLNQRGDALDLSIAGSAADIGNARLAPMLSFQRQRSAVSPTAAASVLAAAPNVVGSQNQLINALLGYGQDVYDTNFNAGEARRINAANNNAAITGAAIKAAGSVAGSYAGQ